MKKLAVLCVAALGAALLVLGTAPSASAYPEITCNVTVAPQVLRPGETFTATGDIPVAVDSHNQPVPDSKVQWTFKWNGDTKERTGKSVHATFTAPKVKKTRDITLTARATSPAGDCVKNLDVTVIAASVAGPHQGDSGLPGTGGPAFWVLVAGLVLLLGGGGAVVVSRRRNDAA
jgi:LPXTG-motif cell wall-anchored protein